MKLSELSPIEKKEVTTFIYAVHSKAWTKIDTEIQVNSGNSDIITLKNGPALEAVLLLRELADNKFYCSLVYAKTSKAFAELAKRLQEEYPNHEVVQARRKHRIVVYKDPKKLLDKIRNFYGRIL